MAPKVPFRIPRTAKIFTLSGSVQKVSIDRSIPLNFSKEITKNRKRIEQIQKGLLRMAKESEVARNYFRQFLDVEILD